MAREVSFGVTGAGGIARRKKIRDMLAAGNWVLTGAVAAAVVGLTLLLPGCGSSNDQTAKEGGVEPGTPPAAPAAPPLTPAAPQEAAPEPPPESANDAPAVPAEQPPQAATPAAAEPVASEPITWGPEKITRSLPLPKAEAPVVMAGPGSPFLFNGKAVIDVGTGESLGEINDTWDKFGTLRALSPDGKAYAVGHANSKRRKTMIAILATTAGKQIHDIEVPQGDARFATEVEHLQFIGPRSLLAICRGMREKSALIYDIVSGTVTKQFPVDDFSDKRTDCSPDGKYLVTGGLNKAAIYEMESGRQVAKLVEPPKDGKKSFLFAGPLAFSPSGTEIAATLGRRVICWNLQGAITYNESCGVESPSGGRIVWVPDESGWIVHGRFLTLREPKLAVWELRDAGSPHFLNQDQLFLLRGNSSDREVVLLPVPWEYVDKATAALKAGAPALIEPGDSVALRLKVGETRFTGRDEVEKQLREAFTDLCGASGIPVAEDSKLVLDVDYSEAAGETRDVVDQHQRMTRPFSKPQTTGQRIQDTTCKLLASLTRQGETEPIWSVDYDSGESHTIFGEVSDKALRDQVFKFMTIRLKKNAIPYFVPKDRQIPSLPIVSNLKE